MAFKVERDSGKKPQNILSRVERDTTKVQRKDGLQFGTQLDKHFAESQDDELKNKAKQKAFISAYRYF